MIRDEGLYLEDILDSINKIEELLRRFSKEQFEDDWLVQDSAIRHLEIIGEAAGKLSGEVRERHLEIPWSQIIAMRNIAIHAYYEVDLDRVWQTMTRDLAALKQALAPELKAAA